MLATISREEIFESYSIGQLDEKKQQLMDTLNESDSLSDFEKIEINNLISLINHRIQLMNELLG